MTELKFSNDELVFLMNLLNKGLFYSEQSLQTWQKVAASNPSAQFCVDDTQLEISTCNKLIEKIKSARGF